MSKESDQLMDAPDGDLEAGDKHMALYEVGPLNLQT